MYLERRSGDTVVVLPSLFLTLVLFLRLLGYELAYVFDQLLENQTFLAFPVCSIAVFDGSIMS